MKRLWAWATGRGGSAFVEGASLQLVAHPNGIVVQPFVRRITARGPVSVRVAPLDTWRVVAVEADDVVLGQAVLAAFDRVPTEARGDTASLRVPGYSEDLRAVLGLNQRAALWKQTGLVSVKVVHDALLIEVWRPSGVAGGFELTRDIEPTRVCVAGVDERAFGQAVRDALDAALSQVLQRHGSVTK